MFPRITNSWRSFLPYSLKTNGSDFEQLKFMNIKSAPEGKFEKIARVHRLSFLIKTSRIFC